MVQAETRPRCASFQPLLKQKACELARIQGTDCTHSDGWLSGWKAQHNIVFKKAWEEIGCGPRTSPQLLINPRRACAERVTVVVSLYTAKIKLHNIIKQFNYRLRRKLYNGDSRLMGIFSLLPCCPI